MEITMLHCQSMRKFMIDGVDYLAVLSPEDPHFDQLEELALNNGFKVTHYGNDPLGEKINHGFIFRDIYDYVMNMGSDDLCDPGFWDAAKSYLGRPVLKVNNIYAAEDISLQNIWEVRGVNIGVLRMIRTDIIKKNLYPPKNKGLDKGSRITLSGMGFEEEVIVSDEIFALDIKGDNSITPIRQWLKRGGKKVDIDLNRFL